MIHFVKKLWVIFLFSGISMVAQINYLPVNHPLYKQIERASLKGLIINHSDVKPYAPRILNVLIDSINKKIFEFNELEKENFSGMMSEFNYQENKVYLENYSVLKFKDTLFTVSFSPRFGYVNKTYGDENGFKRWIGLNVTGKISDWFNFFVDFRDHGEFNGAVDSKKEFSTETGASIITPKGGIEYSDIRGGLSVNWSWGEFSFQKDYFTLGNGEFGQLIHSTKAPSYPFIRFFIQPVDWLRFNYFHGWLNSLFVDSIGYYYRENSDFKYNNLNFVNKYVAINQLSITPFENIDISFGNSSVYKGELKVEMLLPFMFFKYLDRDLGKRTIEDGNGQMFFDIAIRKPTNYKFYGTFFLDVTEIRNLFKADFHNTWFGFTFGMKRIDLLTNNLDFTIEYTRINPWVYEHRDSTTTYKHLNYTMGHWIGQNADQFRIQIDYLILYNLYTSCYLESIRKGGLKDITYAYKNKAKEKFLYGPLRKELRFGIYISYEPIRNFNLIFNYSYNDISDEDINRYLKWMLGKNHSLNIGFFFGF